MPSTPELDPRDWPVRNMAVIVRRHLRNLAKILRPLGLTPQMWRVLNTLAEVGEDNIGTIADMSAYERSYMSRVVERMVAEGYLERASTATDKRYTLVRLTALGRERWQAAMPLVAAAMDNAVAGLTADRLRDLVAALRTVERNVTYPDAVKLAPTRGAPPRTDRRRRA